MMSIGLHLRMIGRPGRIGALDRILRHITNRGDAWFARRVDNQPLACAISLRRLDMSASLIRSRAMVTHAIARHRWNEITDGAVLQEDGAIVEIGAYRTSAGDTRMSR